MADENKDATQTPTETPPAAPVAKNGRYDVGTHRIVVVALSLTVLATGLNITILQALGKEIPAALANLGSTAVGALAMTLGYIMRPQ